MFSKDLIDKKASVESVAGLKRKKPEDLEGEGEEEKLSQSKKIKINEKVSNKMVEEDY